MNVIYKQTSRFYNISVRNRTRLHDLTRKEGELGYCFLHNRTDRIKHVIMAVGPRGKIYGWSAVYLWGRIKVGVFVDKKFRHQGIGTKLKDLAITIALTEYPEVTWSKDGKFITETHM